MGVSVCPLWNSPLTSALAADATTCFRVLNYVLASAAKAEVRGLFQNGQTDTPIRITLHELGFHQP